MRKSPGRESHQAVGAGGHRRAFRAINLALLSLSIAAATAGTSGCTGAPVRKQQANGVDGSGRNGPGLVLAPAANAAGVPVTEPVRVTATSVVLDAVTLTDGQGKEVPGELDASGRTWRSTSPLGFDTRYTLTAAATTKRKRHLTQSAQFSTVKPAKLTSPQLLANRDLKLTDRQVYGVGQPIVVDFGEDVADKAAAERALDVVTVPHVAGAWHWVSDREVHWRPPEYWKTGTKVTVAANTYGKDLGGGLYGKDNASASFSIGPSKVAIADDTTHHIQVLVDGVEVRNVPTAMGRNVQIGGVDLRTRSGPHVVLGNERVTRMTSASFGLTGADSYDTTVEWTTHISYDGEYLHAAPWSVGQQGRANASHGCLNVNTENAIWFFENFGPGDVLDVRNTGIQLAKTDGLGDWTVSWEDWVKGSALRAPAGVRRVN